MKILAVDDAMTVRCMVRNILEDNGHEVHEAENGLTAMDIMNKIHDFDLILLDWEMPEKDGLTFLTELKENDISPETKVIMLTSLSKMANILKAMDAGADEYIMKPFTPEIMIEKVQSIMEP